MPQLRKAQPSRADLGGLLTFFLLSQLYAGIGTGRPFLLRRSLWPFFGLQPKSHAPVQFSQRYLAQGKRGGNAINEFAQILINLVIIPTLLIFVYIIPSEGSFHLRIQAPSSLP